AFEISSNLLTFGGRPEHIYSDMTRWMPYSEGLIGYTTYWSFVGVLLIIIGSLFWVRNSGNSWKDRSAIARQRFHGRPAMLSLLVVLICGGLASILYYKGEVLNQPLSADESIQRDIDYEKAYKKYEGMAQPRVVSLNYAIDLFPQDRSMHAEAAVWIKNKEKESIDVLHFSLPQLFDVSIDIPNAELTEVDEKLRYQAYQLVTPIAPGDSIEVQITSFYEAKGIENELTLPNLTQNGIFINNTQFMPTIGYDAGREIIDKKIREEHGLEEHKGMHSLDKDCHINCRNHFLSADADWVKVRSVVSTSAEQIAIAPGSLVRQWEEDRRAYFEYELESPVLNFYAFLSAEYEQKVERWNGIDLEVYYHPAHAYNTEKMISSMKSSLAYYSGNFSAYPHKQARIIEFPRFARFAQAFPGTMPYSESVGFLADLKSKEDIDGVTYVVAHEMAHQWWAHQLIGAAVEGAQMLAETFAQYSALMVMEKTYGRATMRKFLKHEMDDYLRSRRNLEKEPVLMKVENEGAIYYNKGSVAMYALREYIGEDSINLALRRFIDIHAYSQERYPTTLDFLQELERVTPDSLQFLVDDFFKNITLYDNKIVDATYAELETGEYEVSVKLQTNKLRADETGKETGVSFSDPIAVAVYGEKESDHALGSKLYSGYHTFSEGESKLTFTVKEKPKQVAIDPDYLLPDRFPEDNVRKLD
ncbi:MAG: hypothetical protein HRT61_17855, partial [Ekhidna sp.]|nr:hypothetical protein [Ekhidna sp.]